MGMTWDNHGKTLFRQPTESVAGKTAYTTVHTKVDDITGIHPEPTRNTL